MQAQVHCKLKESGDDSKGTRQDPAPQYSSTEYVDEDVEYAAKERSLAQPPRGDTVESIKREIGNVQHCVREEMG